jgi:hypothetical protein
VRGDSARCCVKLYALALNTLFSAAFILSMLLTYLKSIFILFGAEGWTCWRASNAGKLASAQLSMRVLLDILPVVFSKCAIALCASGLFFVKNRGVSVFLGFFEVEYGLDSSARSGRFGFSLTTSGSATAMPRLHARLALTWLVAAFCIVRENQVGSTRHKKTRLG